MEVKDNKTISLLRNPILTISILSLIIYEQLVKLFKYLISHKYILFIFIVYLILCSLEGIHSGYITYTNKIFFFCGYWILLGVASSIGLGTGLHTFVLYLGPYIAKITLAANECSHFPIMNPNRWEFVDFLPCGRPSDENNKVSLLIILLNVQIESFLWGLGTAIGELPPYFMARGAAETGQHLEELDEIIGSENNLSEAGLVKKLKIFIYKHLKNHGFITVLLCASVINIIFRFQIHFSISPE